MQDFRIGRLNGRFVVMWNDAAGTRRRYRLAAHDAKTAEREARDLILRQTAPLAGLTVAQVWDAYQIEMGHRRMAGKMAESGRNVLPRMGHLSPGQITQDDCRGYIAHRRAQGRKDGTILTELKCLRTALRWAEGAQLIDRAPKIHLPPTPPPRDRYLTRDEVDTLLAAAIAPHIRLAMLLMLTTGGRIERFEHFLRERQIQRFELDFVVEGVMRIAQGLVREYSGTCSTRNSA